MKILISASAIIGYKYVEFQGKNSFPAFIQTFRDGDALALPMLPVPTEEHEALFKAFESMKGPQKTRKTNTIHKLIKSFKYAGYMHVWPENQFLLIYDPVSNHYVTYRPERPYGT